MRPRRWTWLLGSFLCFLGCAGPKEDATGADTSNLTETHLDADNCEVFVDKASRSVAPTAHAGSPRTSRR